MADYPDAAAFAAIEQDVIHPVWVAFLDILGDPIRVTTAPYSLAITGTGDVDLDGHTFSAIDPTFVGVSPVQRKEGGAETVTATLSGLAGIDDDLMTQIGNKANWQGRTARLWQVMFDANLQQVGALWAFYTGYMTVPKITGSSETQVIQLDIESYLAFLAQPSNRSYLNQAEYDPGDLSAEASIAVANGTSGIGLSGQADALAQLAARGGLGSLAGGVVNLS